MNLGLAGRAVVVTGGSDGLGAAVAAKLVDEDAAVAICARGVERLEQQAASLRGRGGDVLAVQADVTRSEDLEGLFASVRSRWGRLDAAVNNAGTAAAAPFGEIRDEEWRDDLELKLMAAVRVTRLAVPLLRESGGGAVVNVLSHAAKAPGARSAPSSVSRAAGMALTKALSKELGRDSIRVNAVLVGLIESGQWARRARTQGKPESQLYEELAGGAGIPLGRVGRAEELADVVAWLVSARSSYVSGVALNVDGGLSDVV